MVGLGEPYLNNLNAVNIQVGQTFIFTFTLNSDAKLRFVNEAGARFQGTWVVYAQGTHTVYITSGISATLIGIQADTNNGSFGVSNISVKESTKNNLARVDYDGTASSLLVEPERTNKVTDSQTFTGALSQVNRESNSTDIEDPFGTNTAFKFTVLTSGADANTRITKSISVTNFSASIYVNGLSGQKFELFLARDSYSQIFSTQEVLSGGWQRIELNGTFSTASATVVIGLEFGFTSDDSVAGQEYYLTGLQVEEGSYSTSYIPTSGTTVTRVQDQYEKTGISNLINSEEGVLFAEIAAFEGANTDRQISISDGSTSNRVVMALLSNGTQIQFVVSSGGSITVNTTQTIPTIISGTKIAFAYKVNNFKIYANGILIASDTNGTVPTGLSVLAFNRGDGNDIFFGKVKQLQVYKTALTDTELATLTTI